MADTHDMRVDYYVLLKPGYDIKSRHELYKKHGGYHGHKKKWFHNILIEEGIIRDIIDSDPITVFNEDE